MISFDINNGGKLTLEQENHDGKIIVKRDGIECYSISPADMVMLLNLYQYTKTNNIQNDFINPSGKNRE